MNEYWTYNLKALLSVIVIILATHTIFFIAYGYLMSGDAFLALKNFYYLTYNMRI